MAKNNDSLRRNALHFDLERAMRYDAYAQIFAIWARPLGERGISLINLDGLDSPPDVLYNFYFDLLSRLRSEFAACGDILRFCLSAADIELAKEEKKVAALISVEGAELLRCSICDLREAYSFGVRLVNLCWNFDNILAGSAMGATRGGLTEEGAVFVREAQRLGVVIDMSHSSEAAFWDTIEIAVSPVIASHSNSWSIHHHPRNLRDRQFKALSDLGGVAGINFYPPFLGLGEDIDAIIAHMEHFLALGGEKSLALGSDFDGVDSLPRDLRGVQHMDALYNAMLKRNFSEALVQDIFYNNLLEALGRIL